MALCTIDVPYLMACTFHQSNIKSRLSRLFWHPLIVLLCIIQHHCRGVPALIWLQLTRMLGGMVFVYGNARHSAGKELLPLSYVCRVALLSYYNFLQFSRTLGWLVSTVCALFGMMRWRRQWLASRVTPVSERYGGQDLVSIRRGCGYIRVRLIVNALGRLAMSLRQVKLLDVSSVWLRWRQWPGRSCGDFWWSKR